MELELEGHSKQAKVRSRCLSKKCLICHQGYSGSTSSNNVGKSTAEKRKLFELLSSLLRVKVKINSSQNGGLSWNFDIEELPFCQPCSSQTEELLHCQQQLEIIQNEMCSLVDSIRQVILESTDKDPMPIRKSKANAKSRDELFRAQIKPGCSLETKADLTRLMKAKQQNVYVNNGRMHMPRVLLTRLTEMNIEKEVERSASVNSPEIVKIEPVQSTDCFQDENDAYSEDWDNFNSIEDESPDTAAEPYGDLSQSQAPGNPTVDNEAATVTTPEDVSLTLTVGDQRVRKSARVVVKSRQKTLGGQDPTPKVPASASFKTPIKKKYKRDNSKRRPDLNLPCTWCDQLFRRTSILKRHKKSVHPEQYFECTTCGKPGTTLETFRTHQLSHKGVEEMEAHAATKANRPDYHKNKKPPRIPFLSSSEQEVQVQVQTVHQCDQCGKVLSSSSSLRTHRTTHLSERNHPCERCEKTYRSHGDLKAHHIRVHLFDRHRFQCPSCLKTFQRAKNLLSHSRVHTGEKPYQCDHCGKSFNGSTNFYRHRKTHQPSTERWQCPYCSLEFRDKRYRQAHIKIKHLLEFKEQALTLTLTDRVGHESGIK